MRIQGSIEINVAPEKVWPFLVEPDKTLKWFTSLKNFVYTSEQHAGVGTTFLWQERSGNRVYNLNFKTTEWVENKVFGYEMVSGDFFKSYTGKWALEPTPSGCLFSLDDNIKSP